MHEVRQRILSRSGGCPFEGGVRADRFRVDIPVLVTEGSTHVVLAIGQPEVHVAISAPVVAAFLGGIAGLFVTLEARKSDERLRIAGMRPGTVALVRLTGSMAHLSPPTQGPCGPKDGGYGPHARPPYPRQADARRWHHERRGS